MLCTLKMRQPNPTFWGKRMARKKKKNRRNIELYVGTKVRVRQSVSTSQARNTPSPMLASRLFPPLEDAYNPSERKREEKKEVKKKGEKRRNDCLYLLGRIPCAHQSISLYLHPSRRIEASWEPFASSTLKTFNCNDNNDQGIISEAPGNKE